MEHYKVIECIEASACTIRLCDDNIVRIDIKNGAEVDVKAIQELYDTFKTFSASEQKAFIYNTKDGTSTMTFEARKFATQNTEYYKKLCVAIVINSLSQRILGNFYLNTVKAQAPYKLFNSLKDAEKWCVKQIEKKSRKRSVNAT
jgi:hypothetical protein